jgi:hypothetical protein
MCGACVRVIRGFADFFLCLFVVFKLGLKVVCKDHAKTNKSDKTRRRGRRIHEKAA